MSDRALVEDYHGATARDRQFADPILFWDETLRDGEQMPGLHFSAEEKLRIAEQLSDIGVAVINAGIPVISEQEASAVRRVGEAGLKAKVLGAARTVPADIDAVIATGVSHIAVFVAASEVHLRYKLGMTQDQVLDAAVASVRRAKQAGLHVAFVTEDTVRAPLDFVERLYTAVVEEGADRIVVSDTVGIMTPLTFRWWLGEFKRRVRPTDWSVHCHNDFGLAVANTLTALEMGVTCPQTCVNGLGERAGNASFEEVAVALESLYGVKTGLATDRIYALSRTVEEASGVPLPPNKALVGYNSFSHEAGIHTHGILKHTLTYEPLQPERVGRRRQMILGKHTGRAALLEKLKERRATPADPVVAELLRRGKARSEAGGKDRLVRLLREYRDVFERPGLTDEEFWKMVDELGIALEAP